MRLKTGMVLTVAVVAVLAVSWQLVGGIFHEFKTATGRYWVAYDENGRCSGRLEIIDLRINGQRIPPQTFDSEQIVVVNNPDIEVQFDYEIIGYKTCIIIGSLTCGSEWQGSFYQGIPGDSTDKGHVKMQIHVPPSKSGGGHTSNPVLAAHLHYAYSESHAKASFESGWFFCCVPIVSLEVD
jgi:hypothetical protein